MNEWLPKELPFLALRTGHMFFIILRRYLAKIYTRRSIGLQASVRALYIDRD